MDATEFRIGNYYQPTDGSGDFAQVTPDDIYAWGSRGARYGKLIPLTDDWLVKFGFYYANTFEKDGIKLSHITTEECYEFEYKLVDGKWKIIPIEYVHQLQNLYFALTGDELTVS